MYKTSFSKKDFSSIPPLCSLQSIWYRHCMVSFSQAKDLFRLQQEAKKIKKQLKSIHVEAEASGVKVIVTAEMEVVKIEIAPEVPRDSLPGLLIDALNRSLKKAQLVSAEHMQGLMGEMGMQMPGQGQE